MSRFIRNTAIQAKIETAYGTDPGTWTATDALLIANASYAEVQEPLSRDLIRPYFGASEHLQVTGRRRITFSVELAGSGTAGTAPAWGILLRACGMAQALTASTMAVYSPVSTAQESISIRYAVDGILHTAVGCRGTATLKLLAYDKPMIEFSFEGLDTVASTAAAVPATDFTAWKKPLPVIPANSAEVRLGGTYASGTGVISGGTALASRGMEVMIGNQIGKINLLSGESVDLTNREVTGRMTNFLSAADEVTYRSAIRANTTTTLGFQLGTTAGAIVGVFGANVQRVDPQNEDYEGRSMLSTSLRFLPSGTAGNDELRIIAR